MTAFEAAVLSVPSEEALQTWCHKGPIRKLIMHNVVMHIEQMLMLRHFCEMKENIKPDSDNGRIYRAIVNGGVIWASSCDMIQSAMKIPTNHRLFIGDSCH